MVHSVAAQQNTGAFGTRRASDLPDADPAKRWLIEQLWLAEAVGVIGAAPKRCKTWLALDIAISVASGTRCLGQFPVRRTGPVLAYIAEGTAAELKGRLNSICASRQLLLDGLDIHIMDDPEAPLDLGSPFHVHRLETTIKQHNPALLLLDPFVRVFHGNEDDASQVSKVLGHLRRLQRRFNVAIIVVHHNAKRSEGGGHALRGSGDFHAWCDSALYLSARDDSAIRITVQHRSARAPDPLAMRLSADEPVHLQLAAADDDPEETDGSRDLEAEILAMLRTQSGALRRADIRQQLKVNNGALAQALKSLQAAGSVIYHGRRWSLADNGIPAAPQEPAG